MHIMFVCTGNICRSPMGELLLTKYLTGTTVRVSSAGICFIMVLMVFFGVRGRGAGTTREAVQRALARISH